LLAPRQLSLYSLSHKLGTVAVPVMLVPFHQFIYPFYRFLFYIDD
tara:strand:- start:1020 stop:1154 length:135 start_codon:yes stop_codon:yes gene_type:complete